MIWFGFISIEYLPPMNQDSMCFLLCIDLITTLLLVAKMRRDTLDIFFATYERQIRTILLCFKLLQTKLD